MASVVNTEVSLFQGCLSIGVPLYAQTLAIKYFLAILEAIRKFNPVTIQVYSSCSEDPSCHTRAEALT